MMDYKLQLDIKIVKFQDYIRRKPDRPFGYYGLGVQYMLSGKSALADKMFMQALKVDPTFTRARLGKLEFLLSEKKFVAAARFFHKNKDTFQQKKLYMKRIHWITSQLYLTKGFYLYAKRFRSLFVFKEGLGALQRMFNNGLENAIVNLLLAMFMLKEGKEDERARVLYNLCVGLEGIEDKLRWDLLQVLSREQPSILVDETIAGMFSAIPDSTFGKNYANFLFSRFMKQQNTDKVMKAFSDLQKMHALPDKKNLWQYLVFCRNRDIWNPTVTLCCQKLIGAGWVDRVVASTLKELKSKGLAGNAREMDKVLQLYGYNEAQRCPPPL